MGTPWYDNQPDGFVYAGKVLYDYKGTIPEGTVIDVEEGTLGISSGIFMFQDGLTSITIPSSVSFIGGQAFKDCRSLKTVVILSENLKSIGWETFKNCEQLSSISILGNLTSIHNEAFENCIGLKTIKLPKTINSISWNAFANCMSLKEFYCEATEVPSTHIKAFIDTYVGNATLYVPEASVNLYKNTAPWSAFGNILPIPATSISTPLMQTGEPDVYYNIQGQHVDNPSKGVFIRNGKKVVIK